jgi:hypothetical protein
MLSSVPCGEASHGAASKSGTIVNVGNSFRPRREIESVEAIEICRAAIWLAFPRASASEVARDAAGPLQSTPHTIYRILKPGETTRFDGGIALRALAFAVASPNLAKDGGKLLPLFNRLSAAVHAAQEGRE